MKQQVFDPALHVSEDAPKESSDVREIDETTVEESGEASEKKAGDEDPARRLGNKLGRMGIDVPNSDL